jgi:hypothetical protein
MIPCDDSLNQIPCNSFNKMWSCTRSLLSDSEDRELACRWSGYDHHDAAISSASPEDEDEPSICHKNIISGHIINDSDVLPAMQTKYLEIVLVPGMKGHPAKTLVKWYWRSQKHVKSDKLDICVNSKWTWTSRITLTQWGRPQDPDKEKFMKRIFVKCCTPTEKGLIVARGTEHDKHTMI